jgi:hypothetical protein
MGSAHVPGADLTLDGSNSWQFRLPYYVEREAQDQRSNQPAERWQQHSERFPSGPWSGLPHPGALNSSFVRDFSGGSEKHSAVLGPSPVEIPDEGLRLATYLGVFSIDDWAWRMSRAMAPARSAQTTNSYDS